jgi:hypothetical protein
MEELAEKWAKRPHVIHGSPPRYKQTSMKKFAKPKPIQSPKKKKMTTSPKKRARINSTTVFDPIPMLTMKATFAAPVLCVAYPWSRLLVMGVKTGEVRTYLSSASRCSVVPGRLCWIMETKGLTKEEQVESHIVNNAIDNDDRVGPPSTSQHVIGAVVFDNVENAVMIKSKEHMMTLANHHLIHNSSSWFPATYPVYMWQVTRSYILMNAWKFTPNNAQGSRKAMAVEGMLEDTTNVLQ